MKQQRAPLTLLIATRNLHKVEEIRAILGGRFSFLTLKDFPNAPNVVEDAATFSGNATKKAAHLERWLSMNGPARKSKPDFVLADDSGLEVDALDGAPGVHSARFAGVETGANGNAKDGDNVSKLLRLLRGVQAAKRTARFRCVVALVSTEMKSNRRLPQLFGGVCEGRITLKPRGTGGFGYDPVFKPDGYSKTFGELGEDVKNKLSHRAKALEKMREWLGYV